MTEVPHFRDMVNFLAAELSVLPDKPEETVDSTLRALWHAASGKHVSAERALALDLPVLSDAQMKTLRELVAHRIGGVPLAHITQRQHFADMEMLAGPDALVPRKETELLARTAISLAVDYAASAGAVRVVDVCTGSGNVALAVAHHCTAASVLAADVSAAAVQLARRNAQHLRLDSRVDFRIGDLLAPFEDVEFGNSVDILTCNPPYINSAKVAAMPAEIAAHEPHLAFDGGAFGIAILMRLLQEAPRVLKQGGWLIFEVGAGQGPALVKKLNAMPAYMNVSDVKDAAGIQRVIAARRA